MLATIRSRLRRAAQRGQVKQGNALRGIQSFWRGARNLYNTSKLLQAGTALASASALSAATPWFMPADADPSTIRNMRVKNFIFGLLMGAPVPKQWSHAAPQIRAGEATAAVLTNMGFNMAERNVRAQESVAAAQRAAAEASANVAAAQIKDTEQAMAHRQAQIQAAVSQAQAADAQASSSKQLRNAALVATTGITLAMAYALWRDRLNRRRALEDASRAGTVRVTLPTPEADIESIVDIPLANLPESTRKSVMRDTRRRLREESETRKRRKTPSTQLQQGAGLYDRLALPQAY